MKTAIAILGLAFAMTSGSAAMAEEPEIELTAHGCYSLADMTGELTVRASGPEGFDISELAYCLCDASGRVVCRYKDKLSRKAKRLKVNLPEGRYALRATDGTKFYGSVPYVVLRRDNPYEKPDGALPPAEIHEPKPESGPSDIERLWHDFKNKGEDRLLADVAHPPPRMVGVRYADIVGNGEAFDVSAKRWADDPDALCDAIDKAAAKMKSIGANLLVVPALGKAQCEPLEAWRIKFANEGLHLDTDGGTRLPVDIGAGDALTVLPGPEGRLPPVRFAQAFRALPPVVFEDLDKIVEVKLRHKEFDGRSWFYVVNTGNTTETVWLVVPRRARDLVEDERVGGIFSEETLVLTLKPHEMRSYAAPEGRPRLQSVLK